MSAIYKVGLIIGLPPIYYLLVNFVNVYFFFQNQGPFVTKQQKIQTFDAFFTSLATNVYKV